MTKRVLVIVCPAGAPHADTARLIEGPALCPARTAVLNEFALLDSHSTATR